MIAGNGTALFDANGNPLAATPGTTLASPQAGVVALGADAGGIARVPKVDATGSQYVVQTTPSGTSTLVNTGQAAGAAGTQFGNLIMARMDAPAPATYQALMTDPVGGLQTHAKSKQTFNALALNVTCGTNVILFALQNTGSMVVRLQRVTIYIPPAGGTGGALLGQGTGQSYYPVFCELRRATSYSGGTAVIPGPADSNDVLGAGITCAKAVTSVSGTPVVWHYGDAYSTNVTGLAYYERGPDANNKTFIIRPGECGYIVCTSNGTVNSTTAGGGTVTAQASIVATFTQAPA